MDATRRLHHPGTRPAQQVEGIDDERLDRLIEESARATATTEVSVSNELIFVLTLDG
jgi:hypothetical protein